MVILYRNLLSLKMNDIFLDCYITLEGNTLTCSFYCKDGGTMPSYMRNYTNISYNGTRRSTSITDNVLLATASYTEGVNELKIICSTSTTSQRIYYGDKYYGTSLTLSWEYPDTVPVCSFAPEGIYEDYGNRLSWQVSSGDGSPCCAVRLWYYEKGSGDVDYTCTELIGGKYTANSYTHNVPAGSAGKQCYYKLAYCSYSVENAAEDKYLVYAEKITSVMTIGGTKKYPPAPASILYGRPAAGGSLKISWEAVTDSYNTVTGYRLERKVNSGNWVLIYSGSSTSFTDSSIPENAESVVYRVRSADSDGDLSEWKQGETVEVLVSNIYVMHGGRLAPAVSVYVGGIGKSGAMAYVGS